MNKRITAIVFLAFLFFSANLFAQTKNVTISGLVTNLQTGDPLIGTNILLYRDSITANTFPFRGASTNRFGFYAIPNIPKGNYVLVFRNLGFETVVEKIDIKLTRGTINLNVKMKPKDVELEEVVIRGEKRKESGISTINVSPELLKMLPSFSGELNLFKSLQMLPGVKTASEMSNGLYVRGGSPDQTLILVDGVIMYNPAHLGNIASAFNSDAIYDIRLIKGAYPAEYGGRLSSVLDIKLRSGTKEREKGTLGIGSIMSFGTIEGPISENTTYMISSRIMYYDFFQSKFDNKSKIPRYNFVDLNSKINYAFDDNSVLFLSSNYNSDHIYNPPFTEDFNYDIGWKNTTITLNWFKITSKSIFLNVSAGYINYVVKSALEDISDSLADDYFSLSDLKDFFLKAHIEYILDENHKLKSGLEVGLHGYTLLNRNFYDPVLETSPDYEENLLSTEASLFLQDEWKILPTLSANIGIRATYFKDSDNYKFEPRISFAYALSGNFFFKGAYAVANQFLHLITRNDITLPTDLWYPSSKKILPSNSTQYVLGWDLYFNEKEYLFSVEGYYRTMKNIYEFKDVLEYDRTISIEENFTEGEGEAYGIEFFLNKRMGNFSGWVGYTLSWSRRLFEHLNAGRIFFPRYDRRHDVSVVLGYKASDKLSFGLTWTFATGQGYTMPNSQYVFSPLGVIGERERRIQFNYTNRNGYKLPDYHKLDLSANYKFLINDLNAEVFINLQNVYNRKNAFARYITYDVDEKTGEQSKTPKLKQITLMPFVPTFGIVVRF